MALWVAGSCVAGRNAEEPPANQFRNDELADMDRDQTRVEFYRKGGGLIIAVVGTSAVPRKGEFINIGKKNWKVVAVTWAVDQPGGTLKPRLRANVEMEPVE